MLQVIDCSMIFTFSKQVENILVHLPSGENDVIAGLDISDLSSIVAIVNNIIIKPLEFDYSVIRFHLLNI